MSGTRTIYILGGAGVVLYLVILGLILYGLRSDDRPPQRPVTIASISPSTAVLGEDVEITVKGTGFDQNTRVALVASTGNEDSLLSTIPTWGPVKDMASTEDFLFALSGRRLIAVDIRDPAAPSIVGSLTLPAAPFKIVVAGKTVWIAMKEKILAVDISDPANLKALGVLELAGPAADIAVKGNTAVAVSTRLNAIYSIDVSDPSNPRLMDTVPVAQPFRILQEKDLFLIGCKDSIQVAKTTQGKQLELLSHLPIEGPIIDFAVSDEQIIAISPKFLYTTQVTDSPKLVLREKIEKSGVLRSIEICSDGVYLLSSENLKVLAGTDLKREIRLSEGFAGGGTCLALSRQGVFIGTSFGGIQSTRLPPPPRQPLDGKYNSCAQWGNLHGNLLSFSDGAWIRLATIDPKGTLILRGEIDLNEEPAQSYTFVRHTTYTHGNTLYIATHQGTRMADISNPDTPRILGIIEGVRSFAIAGRESTLYVAHPKEGLAVIDLREGQNHRLLSQLQTPDATTLTLRGNLLFLGKKGGMIVFDVSTPERPRQVGELDLPWHMKELSDMRNLVVEGAFAYAADGRNGLLIIDVKDPRKPRLLRTVDFLQDTVLNVSISRSILYALATKTGTLAIDVSEPTSPRPLAVISPSKQSTAIPDGKGALLLLGLGGVRVLPEPVTSKSIRRINSDTLVATVPSPSRPGVYTVRVLNGRGESQSSGALTFAPPP